jgi:hypothetical protein
MCCVGAGLGVRQRKADSAGMCPWAVLQKRLREDTEVTNAISGGLAGGATARMQSAAGRRNTCWAWPAGGMSSPLPVLAGAITATVVCPLDVLKTRLQVQGKAAMRYTGISGEGSPGASSGREGLLRAARWYPVAFCCPWYNGRLCLP